QGNEVALYEVLWQTEDVTSMVPGIATESRPARAMRLRLRCDDRELLGDERHSSITIGRAEDNDVVVKGNLISRLHARIEINRNKFVLIDQSTNGTFVQSADGEESFVRRDSLQIKGQGMIGLGRLPEQGSPQTRRFICEETGRPRRTRLSRAAAACSSTLPTAPPARVHRICPGSHASPPIPC